MTAKSIDKYADAVIRAGLLITAAFSLADYAIRHLGLPAAVAAGWDEILLIILLGAWLAKAAAGRKLSLTAPRIDRALGAVALTAVLSLLVNRVPLTIGCEALRVLLQAALFYFAAANCIRDSGQLKQLVTVMLFAVTVVAAYGVYQYAIGIETPKRWVVSEFETLIKTRVFSTIGNPNALGGYLVLFLPLALTLALDAKERAQRLLYGGAAALMFLCLLFTFSRGAWLGFLASLVLLAVWKDRRILLALGVGLLALPVLMPAAVSRMLFIFSPEYLGMSYTWGRLRFWLTALAKMRAHPLFGAGLGTFGDTVAMRHNLPGAIWVDNHYLKLGAEMGVPGLAAFLWLIREAIRTGAVGRREARDSYHRSLLTGVTAGLAAVAVQNFTASIWEVLIVGAYWWFLAGMQAAIGRIDRAEREGR